MTEHNTNEEQLIDTTTIEPEYLRVIALRDRPDSTAYSYANAGKLVKYITERMYELGIKNVGEELPENAGKVDLKDRVIYETRERVDTIEYDDNIREISIADGESYLQIVTEIPQTSYGVTLQKDSAYQDGRLKRGGSPRMLEQTFSSEDRVLSQFGYTLERGDVPTVDMEYEVKEERPINYDIYSQRGLYSDEDGLNKIQLQRLSMYGLNYDKVQKDRKRKPYVHIRNVGIGLYKILMGEQENSVINQPNMYDSCYVCWGNTHETRAFRDKSPQEYTEYLTTFYAGKLNTDLGGKKITLGAVKRYLTAVKFQFENIYSNPETNPDYEHDMELLELTNFLLDNITKVLDDLAEKLVTEDELEGVTEQNKYIIAESAYTLRSVQPYTYLAQRSGVPIDYINQFSYATHQAFLELGI